MFFTKMTNYIIEKNESREREKSLIRRRDREKKRNAKEFSKREKLRFGLKRNQFCQKNQTVQLQASSHLITIIVV